MASVLNYPGMTQEDLLEIKRQAAKKALGVQEPAAPEPAADDWWDRPEFSLGGVKAPQAATPAPLALGDTNRIAQEASKLLQQPTSPVTGTAPAPVVTGMDPVQRATDEDFAAWRAGQTQPNTVAAGPAPSVLTPEMQRSLDAAKAALAGGDTAGAAQSVLGASNLVSIPGQQMSPTQAVQNVQAVQQGTPAVNTASPTGLWQGTVSEGNPAQAPTSVIEQTATPTQAQQAAQTALNAPATATRVLGAPLPVEGTGDVLTDTQGTGQQPPAAAAGSGSAGAPTEVAPNQTGYQGGPQTTLDLFNDPDALARYQEIAKAALGLKYDPQIEGITQGLTRARRGMEGDIASAQRSVMDAANRRGVGLWGTTTNAQAQVAGRAMELLGQEETLANQRIEGLRQSQQNELLPFIQQLFTSDRDFQENVRQFGLDYAIRKATSDFGLKRGESLLPYEIQGAGLGNQLSAFQLSRGQQMLPYELQGAGLANQGAAFDLQRGQGLLPYELQGANLGNQQAAFNLQSGQQLLPHQIAAALLGNTGAGLANEGANISNETAAWNLANAQATQPIQVEAAHLANQAAALRNQVGQLEWTLANDPDVGKRAQAALAIDQAKKQLEVYDSQIKENNAQALKASQPQDDGFTAWQQYQMLRDEKSDAEKEGTQVQTARKEAVKSYQSIYKVDQTAADTWVELLDLSKGVGRLQGKDITAIINRIRSQQDTTVKERQWLEAMVLDAFGSPTNVTGEFGEVMPEFALKGGPLLANPQAIIDSMRRDYKPEDQAGNSYSLK